MSRQKREAARARMRELAEHTCSNCGGPGRHFVPPGLGSDGFYMCDSETEDDQ